MKNFTTAIISILFTVSIQSQKFYTHIDYRGDTTELKIIENPTVCDCENIDWRNKGQEKICNLTYDYDFMSEEEKKNMINNYLFVNTLLFVTVLM